MPSHKPTQWSDGRDLKRTNNGDGTWSENVVTAVDTVTTLTTLTSITNPVAVFSTPPSSQFASQTIASGASVSQAISGGSWLVVQVTAVTGAGTAVIEQSLDNTNWVGSQIYNINTGLWVATITAAGVYGAPANGLFWRLRCNGGTSVTALGGTQGIAPNPTNGAVNVAGAVAHGAADSGNPAKVGGKYNSAGVSLTDGNRSDLQLGQRGAVRVELTDAGGATTMQVGGLADASSNTVNALAARVYSMIFNGTTWDRLKGDTTNGLFANVKQVATGQGRTLKFASVSTAASGDTSLVAAVASNKIKLVSYVLVAAGAVTARWYSGAAGTALSGAMSLAANGGISAQGQVSSHLMETAVNTALVLNLGSAIQVSGHLAYFEEP